MLSTFFHCCQVHPTLHTRMNCRGGVCRICTCAVRVPCICVVPGVSTFAVFPGSWIPITHTCCGDSVLLHLHGSSQTPWFHRQRHSFGPPTSQKLLLILCAPKMSVPCLESCVKRSKSKANKKKKKTQTQETQTRLPPLQANAKYRHKRRPQTEKAHTDSPMVSLAPL